MPSTELPSSAPRRHGRLAGLLVPLFSMPSSRSWGIGEIPDIPVMTDWMRRAGFGLLQLLPLNEMASWSQSPYSATSAMAIDPIYLAVDQIDEFAEIGGVAALPSDRRADLDAARAASAVDYARVRRVKAFACRAAWERFRTRHLASRTSRARAFLDWVDRESWWVDPYALYRAVHMHFGERSWREWTGALRTRQPDALEAARALMEDDIRFRQYLQWQAAEQWDQARASARPVALFGDLPFMVDGDSADVWARQRQFRLDASVGAPPDAFSDEGQNWGLPPCDWNAMAADGFRWIHERARRGADLFDGFRIDHLVGFYRTYTIPADGSPRGFNPTDEPQQLALGETLVRAFAEAGATVIAEDLGTVPDFVRESLARLGIPGFKVLRWERRWHDPGQPFRDPGDYTPVSVATSGTHDTEPLAAWWGNLTPEDRIEVGRIPSLRRHLGAAFDEANAPFSPVLRDGLLQTLYESGSDLLILPVQDLFGLTARINVPATVDDSNWTWRLPWPVDSLDARPEVEERAEEAARWSADASRTSF